MTLIISDIQKFEKELDSQDMNDIKGGETKILTCNDCVINDYTLNTSEPVRAIARQELKDPFGLTVRLPSS